MDFTGIVECPQCGFESEDVDLEICPKCGLDFNDYIECPYKISSNKCELGNLCSIDGLAIEGCPVFIKQNFHQS